MKLLYHPIFLEHDTGNHPENKKRLAPFAHLPAASFPNGEPYLGLVHTQAHIEYIRQAAAEERSLNIETIFSRRSFEVACQAVGASIQAAEQGDFALVRPPGHHAYADQAGGFCLFNNIAVATAHLLQQGKRVLILDFDGHLGDGTASIFYQNDQVLFWSLHQYPAYPGHGYVYETGEGPGKGFTINTPLPAKSGDDIFLYAFRNYLSYAEAFQPDVVAVSAGFDGHYTDLLLDLRLTLTSYYAIGAMLRERFQHIFAVLEGGYSLDILEKGVYSFLAGINGEEMPFVEKPTESTQHCWEEFELSMHAGLSLLGQF